MTDPTQPAEDFHSQVQRLVTEGKLSAEDAQGLLENTGDQGHQGTQYREMDVSYVAASEGQASQNLLLEVSGYGLQVVLDETISQPQLNANEEGKLTLEATPEGWVVKRPKGQGHFGWTTLKAILLVPFTPADVRATLGGGALKLPDITGTLTTKVGGGSLTLDSCHHLHASIGGGSLKAEQVRGNTYLTIGGGSASLGTSGNVNATVAGGSLNLIALMHSGENQITVAGGSAKLELLSNSSVELTAQATAGHVKTNFPVTKTGQFGTHTYRGSVGDGTAKLNIKVAGGSVLVLSA